MKIGSIVIHCCELDKMLAFWLEGPGQDFVVLKDPDGNAFCVVQAAS